MQSKFQTVTASRGDATDLVELVEQLASTQPGDRESARQLLARYGHDAAVALLVALYDPRDRVRWEAAKALEKIADPVAAPALVLTLDDDNEDVRWVAADALVAIGENALRPLLGSLIRYAGSVDFRRATHHVLHELERQGNGPLLQPLLRALESSEPAVAVPPACLRALQQLD